MHHQESSTIYRFKDFLQRHRKATFVAVLFLIASIVITPTILAAVRITSYDQPGTAGNTTRLINNWLITPAGKQTLLGDLPLNAVLSPNGRSLLVTNGGAGVQSLQVVDTKTTNVIQTIPYTVPNSVFVGLAYSPDGAHAYASGGGSDVVHTYDVLSSGQLSPAGDVVIGTTKANPFPTGLSISPDGKTLYVANNLANTVSVVDTATRTVTATIAIGSYPYTTLVSDDNKTVYASNWGEGTISVIDAGSKKVTATVAVGNHPSAMTLGPDGEKLYVADANSDAVSVIDTASNNVERTISVSPYAHAPLSSSPEGLAVSKNGRYLYVVTSGNNAVVVVDLEAASNPVLGRIPTAWYPTSVVLSKSGETLYITNAKGRGAGPNDKKYSPNPEATKVPIVDGVTGYNDGYCNCTFDQYSGSMIRGTLSTVTVPGKGLLALYTSQVAHNNHVGDKSLLERSPGNPIPLPGGASPIKHVIYIVKENRTYDQVFGDLPAGNGDPNLTLFPQTITPNLHALTEHYGIFDNFYADAEVSADGHNWINSANASDYNEKMWPQDYSPGVGRNRGYDFEGDSTINLSAGGYIWDASAEAHITYRNYGEFYLFDANYPVSKAKLIPVSQASTCTGPVASSYSGVTVPAGQVLCFLPMNVGKTTTANLVGHYDPRFRTFDLRYREADRIAEWQREYQQFVANSNLPSLEILRLPNDHTSGTSPNRLTPQASVAENDEAVGKVVDIVSHSKYWASTAIFVTEDDAQNGPDHVDAHRTEALVISPYTYHKNAFVDHTLYDTAAMVRTIELILGLRTLSQYDTAAIPMWRDFHQDADTTPYTALPEGYSLTQTNTAGAYGAQQSAQIDFVHADNIPEAQLNQILWHAVKGEDTPYPGTVGATDGSSTANSDG